MDKCLLVYAGFGEGHKKAAFALKDFLGAACVDILDFSRLPLKRLYSYGYVFITTHLPILWQILFMVTERLLVRKIIEKYNVLFFHKFVRYLLETHPTTLITSHFFLPSVACAVKKRLNIKIISMVTDLRVHPLWVHPAVDAYIVALSETKNDLVKYGVSQEKVTQGFVPLREGFLREAAIDTLRAKFGLDQKPCILFVSSARGRIPLVERLLPYLKDSFNVFVIYGRNTHFRKEIEALGFPSVKLFPFFDDIHELVSLSAYLVTKPGGITIFEGIYKKKLFIFTHYIPGQEKGNMDILISSGIAKYVRNEADFCAAIAEFQHKEVYLKESYPITVEDTRIIINDIINKLHK